MADHQPSEKVLMTGGRNCFSPRCPWPCCPWPQRSSPSLRHRFLPSPHPSGCTLAPAISCTTAPMNAATASWISPTPGTGRRRASAGRAGRQDLAPLEGDNSPQIQAAIDEVSMRTPDASGLRGGVALRAGDYRADGTVTIAAGGVVLRGSGSGDGGAVIHLAGDPHRFLEIHGGRYGPVGGAAGRVAAAYRALT
jgi:hypothetical protein